MPIDVQVDPNSYAQVMAALKRTNPEAYKALQQEARKLAFEVKRRQTIAVKGLSSSGSSKGRDGRYARQLAALEANAGKSERARQSAARRAGSLRNSVAATLSLSIRSTTTDPSRRPIQVGVRMNSKKMPPGQQRLPKHMNYGEWRHPVFGNKNVWAITKVVKDGWFDATFAAMRSRMELVLINRTRAAYLRAMYR